MGKPRAGSGGAESWGDRDTSDQGVVAVLAELESGAADDLATVITLDPEPYGRSVETGQSQVDLVQEVTNFTDIRGRQALQNHGAIIGYPALRYADANWAC